MFGTLFESRHFEPTKKKKKLEKCRFDPLRLQAPMRTVVGTTNSSSTPPIPQEDGSQTVTAETVGRVIYFGGDSQDSYANMKKGDSFTKFSEYCLEKVNNNILAEKFANHNILVMKPSLINNSFSVFRNFLCKVDDSRQPIPCIIEPNDEIFDIIYNININASNKRTNVQKDGFWIQTNQCCAHLYSILLKLEDFRVT